MTVTFDTLYVLAYGLLCAIIIYLIVIFWRSWFQ